MLTTRGLVSLLPVLGVTVASYLLAGTSGSTSTGLSVPVSSEGLSGAFVGVSVVSGFLVSSFLEQPTAEKASTNANSRASMPLVNLNFITSPPLNIIYLNF